MAPPRIVDWSARIDAVLGGSHDGAGRQQPLRRSRASVAGTRTRRDVGRRVGRARGRRRGSVVGRGRQCAEPSPTSSPRTPSGRPVGGAGSADVVDLDDDGRRRSPTDPEVAIGTLDNGLDVLHPGRTTTPAAGPRCGSSIDAGSVERGARPVGRRPLPRAHAVQRHRAVPGERADRRPARLRRRVRRRHQRLHQLRRDRVPSSRSPPTTTSRRDRARQCSTSGCRPRRSTRPRSRRSGAWCSTSGVGRTQTSQGRLFDAIERLFLAGTGYEGRDPIGTEEAIEAMTPEPLRRFYDQWYRPDNAAVVVVGDIDVDDIEEAIVERFESLSARAQPAALPDLTFSPDTEPAVEVHADPDQPAAFVEVTLPMPAVRTRRHRGLARRAPRRDRVLGDRRSAVVRPQRRWDRLHRRVRRLEQPRQRSRRTQRAGRRRRRPACPTRCRRSSTRWSESSATASASTRSVGWSRGRRTAAESAYDGPLDRPGRRVRRALRRQLPHRRADPRRGELSSTC